MKILIVRLSAFGDIVHSLPLAENARLAGATVGWLCETRYRELLEGNPNIDRLFLADTRAWRRAPVASDAWRSLGRLRAELRAFAPDHAIDVQGLWKSAILARLAGAPVVGLAGFDRREGASALLASRCVRPPPEARHVVDQNLSLLSAIGIPILRRAPDATYLLARPDAEASAFLAAQPQPYALYHPGAGRPEKAWGEERLADLARRLESQGIHPVISWGPGDEERVERMGARIPEARRIPALAPRGLAHVLHGAALFLGGDTGPLHLADALGVPTLALFGPANAVRHAPARNGPYRGASLCDDARATPEAVADRALEILARARG